MESCLRSCCCQEVWIHVTNQSPFQTQKRRMSGLVLQMDQAHMWVENLDRYGAWKLIAPHVAATKWCTHISSSAVGKKNQIPGFNKNSLTSALYLSDYPTQGLFHQIWEVHQWVYCQPDQASIALIGCLEMVGWHHWACWSSRICRQSTMKFPSISLWLWTGTNCRYGK